MLNVTINTFVYEINMKVHKINLLHSPEQTLANVHLALQ